MSDASTNTGFDPQLTGVLADMNAAKVPDGWSFTGMLDEAFFGPLSPLRPAWAVFGGGTPTYAEQTDLALDNMRQVALAGGSISAQQGAYNGTFKDIQDAANNFDTTSASNILQRAADAIAGTAIWKNVLGDTSTWKLPAGSIFDWPSLDELVDWKTIAILGLVLLVVFLILKEVF